MNCSVSIVIPIYNEELNLEELVFRIFQTLEYAEYVYEVIVINDGSSDSSWEKIINLSAKYNLLRGIDLAGNYGQTIALRAGFEAAYGEIIIAMDGDLQHNPEDIPRFVELIQKGYDMVGGYKEERPEVGIKKWLSNSAHLIIQMISGVKLKYFGATFKAYRKYLLNNSNFVGDSTRFMGALVLRKGMKFTEIPLKINERKAGNSNYKFGNVIFEVVLDLIFLKFFLTYMHKPFRLFGVIGIASFIVGLCLILAILFGFAFCGINIKENYLAEFLFSIFLIVLGFMFFGFGIIAEIGVYNYFLKKNDTLYNIRSKTNFKLQ